MIQSASSIKSTSVFIAFSALFLIAFFLPAYQVPAFFMLTLEEKFPYKVPPLMLGYECAWGSMITMLKSPVAFLGTLANFAVLTVWILFLVRMPGKMSIFRSLLIVTCMVSVLIWPIALRSGFQWGYYLWAISAVGISVSYGNLPVIESDTEDTLLDEHI